MAWTNAFEVGECTVIVTAQYGDDYASLFEGILGRGDGADLADASGDHLPLRVDVLDDGAVVLSCSDDYNITSYNFDTVALRVLPTYEIADKPLRMSGITVDRYAQEDIPAWADFDSWISGAAGINLYHADTSVTSVDPDPADLSDQPSKTELGMAIWRALF